MNKDGIVLELTPRKTMMYFSSICPGSGFQMTVSAGTPNLTIQARRGNCFATFFTARGVLSMCLVLGACVLLISQSGFADDEGIEFFESKIRPVLVEHCYQCHSGDAKNLKGGLLLEVREQLLKGGDTGPAIVDGKPAESLLIESLKWEGLEMPPKGKLPPKVIADFEKWISIGAPWPANKSAPMIASEQPLDWKQLKQDHWSFRPVEKFVPPSVKRKPWNQHPVDQFIEAKRAVSGLNPAPPASAVEMVRRLNFDLVGIPPNPDEVAAFSAAFTADPDKAIAERVETLLKSPLYGERWARHWLDVARFSDGFGGFNDGEALPDAWRYRDWVISVLNDDISFDEFIRLQIAGDLDSENPQPAATGFFAIGPTYRSDGGDPDSVAQAKSETLDDRIDTLTRGILGITAACSRCHDHKFDPIPQMDYYSLAGVFQNTTVHQAPLVPAEEVKKYNDHQQRINEKNNQIKQLNQKIKNEKRQASEEEKLNLKNFQTELDQLKKSLPPRFPTAHALRDTGSKNMKVAIRGDLRKTGKEAPRRFLRILAGESPPEFKQGSGRQELAAAIISKSNPLTRRVFVNRIWQIHFGKALVRTPSNFGKLGEPPTHPKLLDYLADFLAEKDSIKDLHRLLLNSQAYRMSSQFDQKSFENDGDNRFLWRMNPRRLDVEAWRDSLLTVTGELDRSLGGPPTEDTNSKRRTLYFKVSRAGDRFGSDELLRMFDFPIMRSSVAKRPTSIVPQQYLFMLNSGFMVDRAKAFNARIQKLGESDEDKINAAYRILFGRKPEPGESKLGLQFVRSDQGKVNAWEKYAQVLLSSNEFFHVQ